MIKPYADHLPELSRVLNDSYLSGATILPHHKEKIIQNPSTLMSLGILSHIEEVKGANYD